MKLNGFQGFQAVFRILLMGSALSLAVPSIQPCRAEGNAVYRIYFGTYTRGESRGIYTCDMDTVQGTLSAPKLVAEVRNPSFLAFHPTLPRLYAVSELWQTEGPERGAVTAFAIDDASGELRELNQEAVGGAGPCHLAVSPGGRCLVTANYGSGSTSVLPLDGDGRLLPRSCVIQHEGSGPNASRQKGPHAHQTIFSPGGGILLVPDLGIDQVLLYRLDETTGTLSAWNPPGVAVPPGSGPRHCAYHPTGKFLYVVNELASTVSVFACADEAPVRLLQTISTLPPEFDGQNTTAEIEVHPSGRFAYASNRGHDSIAAFAVDSATGKLSEIDRFPSGGKVPRNFALAPGGRFMLAANQDTDNVVVFAVDQATGRLQPTGVSVQVGAPVCIVFRPMR
ncbi:lactonase family protein [Thermopirellula anaerolimosa]